MSFLQAVGQCLNPFHGYKSGKYNVQESKPFLTRCNIVSASISPVHHETQKPLETTPFYEQINFMKHGIPTNGEDLEGNIRRLVSFTIFAGGVYNPSCLPKYLSFCAGKLPKVITHNAVSQFVAKSPVAQVSLGMFIIPHNTMVFMAGKVFNSAGLNLYNLPNIRNLANLPGLKKVSYVSFLALSGFWLLSKAHNNPSRAFFTRMADMRDIDPYYRACRRVKVEGYRANATDKDTVNNGSPTIAARCFGLLAMRASSHYELNYKPLDNA